MPIVRLKAASFRKSQRGAGHVDFGSLPTSLIEYTPLRLVRWYFALAVTVDVAIAISAGTAAAQVAVEFGGQLAAASAVSNKPSDGLAVGAYGGLWLMISVVFADRFDAWRVARNAAHAVTTWMLGVEQARTKLGHAYPAREDAAREPAA